jgi:hypothetical protein
VRQGNPGHLRTGSPPEGAHTRVPHPVAVADSHPEAMAVDSRSEVAAVGSRRPEVAAGADSRRQEVVVAGSRRQVVAAGAGSRRQVVVAEADSRQEAVDSSPGEGAVDQSSGLPDVVGA